MDGLSNHTSMPSHAVRRLALLAVLTALCIGIQLTPRPPNIEFTSLIVFLIGVAFGALSGSMVGVLVMLVNGFCSSWGFAGLMLPFQVAGMAIVGIGGGLYGRTGTGSYASRSCLETAVLGAFLTLVYDIITNFGVAISYMLMGMPFFVAFVSAIVSGALFSLVHVVSNAAVFGVAFVPLTNSLQKLLGGGKTWKERFSLT